MGEIESAEVRDNITKSIVTVGTGCYRDIEEWHPVSLGIKKKLIRRRNKRIRGVPEWQSWLSI